jgi:xanthine dehydrogenase accessory factor
MPELLQDRRPDAATWIVIATRGHRTDEDVLRAALAGPAAYVGMIGSPSKVRSIFTKLLASGASPDDLARVHAPIGLDLGAQTPGEIALSIAAEMLMMRRGAGGAPLRQRHDLLAEAQAAATRRPRHAKAESPAGEAAPSATR